MVLLGVGGSGEQNITLIVHFFKNRAHTVHAAAAAAAATTAAADLYKDTFCAQERKKFGARQRVTSLPTVIG